MDGTVSLLDGETGHLICKQKVHQKYVVKVLWGPDEQTFLTASWDGSAYVFSHQGEPDNMLYVYIVYGVNIYECALNYMASTSSELNSHKITRFISELYK